MMAAIAHDLCREGIVALRKGQEFAVQYLGRSASQQTAAAEYERVPVVVAEVTR